jgi:inner membrane protein
MKSILLGKLAGLLLVVVLLLFGLDQITNLVHERQATKQDAVNSVAQSLAGSQTLLGPLVHQTCTEDVTNPSDKNGPPVRREFERVSSPATLGIEGDSQLEARSRGLYATQVFTLKAKLTARWNDLKPLETPRGRTGANMQCGPVLLMLAVSDARGIRQADVTINGVAQTVRAGTQHGAYPRGVQVSLPDNTDFAAPMTTEIQLELLGTEALRFVPLGGATPA